MNAEYFDERAIAILAADKDRLTSDPDGQALTGNYAAAMLLIADLHVACAPSLGRSVMAELDGWIENEQCDSTIHYPNLRTPLQCTELRGHRDMHYTKLPSGGISWPNVLDLPEYERSVRLRRMATGTNAQRPRPNDSGDNAESEGRALRCTTKSIANGSGKHDE